MLLYACFSLVLKKIFNQVFDTNCCVNRSFNVNMLIQEHKDKIIHTQRHEVLTWFNLPYLHSWMGENHSTIS